MLTEKPLSYSQMSQYLTCRYRWYLSYVLGIRPPVRTAPMELGDAVHRALAVFLSGGNAADGISAWYADIRNSIPIDDPDINDRIERMLADAVAIANRAIQGLAELGFWTLNDDAGKPYVERNLIVAVPGWAGFVGYIDWIARDVPNARNWVVDHKTRGYLSSDADEESSLQNAIYQALAWAHGIETVGTLTYQVKSTPPKKPKLNRDGSMSRAAVATDWDGYRATLIEANLDPSDYDDMRLKLSDNEFVRVTRVIRSPETVAAVWNEIVEPVASEMASAFTRLTNAPTTIRPRIVTETAPRNMSPRTCGSCAVRDVCFAKLKGYDAADIVRSRFTHKPGAVEALSG